LDDDREHEEEEDEHHDATFKAIVIVIIICISILAVCAIFFISRCIYLRFKEKRLAKIR
jgi:flagellar basal body-associated protein FliL